MFDNKEVEKEDNHIIAFNKILECIDLTSLNDNDTEESIQNLCVFAKNIRASINKNGIASVCVYPKFAKQVRKELANTGIAVACVAGNFPSGEGDLQIKLNEVKFALNEGAQEIDYVICKKYIPSAEYDKLFEEVHSVKQICGAVPLKIILETGELKTIEEIQKGSETAIEAGADFIKTSTGKNSVAATPEAAWVMTNAIKAYHQKTGKIIGFKPAGGISTVDDAIIYWSVVEKVLGEK